MITVKWAKRGDSEQLADFIIEAGEDLVHTITGYPRMEDARKQLVRFVSAEDTRFSYRNCLTAEEDGKILGAVLFYNACDLPALDSPVNAHLRSLGSTERLAVECKPGELYVDSIAVAQHARGRGIAAMLLDAVCRQSADAGLYRVSLLVDTQKPRVQALYQRCGFREDGTFSLAGHSYIRMLKEIPPSGPAGL